MFTRVACVMLAIGCLSVCAVMQTEQSGGRNTLSLDERLGLDDGAALAILYGAGVRGNIEVCD